MEGCEAWSSPRKQLSWYSLDRLVLRLVGANRVDPLFGFHSHSNHGKGEHFREGVEFNRVVRLCSAHGGSGGNNMGRKALLQATLVCHPRAFDGNVPRPCFSAQQALCRYWGCLPLASRRTVGQGAI